jgi:hypothetical protein
VLLNSSHYINTVRKSSLFSRSAVLCEKQLIRFRMLQSYPHMAISSYLSVHENNFLPVEFF